MITKFVLIFCLFRASCVTIPMDNEELCRLEAARLNTGYNATAVCMRRTR
jgi:hypothetical protein